MQDCYTELGRDIIAEVRRLCSGGLERLTLRMAFVPAAPEELFSLRLDGGCPRLARLSITNQLSANHVALTLGEAPQLEMLEVGRLGTGSWVVARHLLPRLELLAIK